MANIKKNFFYSSILTTANYIFPMLTYPYVSRVLGVEKIGLCNFADSIIGYFLLFSFLGMGTVGIREIAKYKDNPSKLNNVYSSLIVLNSISTFIALTLLLVATFTVPQLMANKELMLVGAVRLLVSYLQVEWLFKGLEDFKYITLRSVSIKMLYVIGVFLLVKTKDDYIIYFALYTAMTAVNAFVNIWYARNFVRFSIIGIHIKPYVKSFITLGGYMFLTSMYSSFNVAFLGFTGGEREVGYYTTATKLYAILLSLFTAFTGVMLPRMSSLIAKGEVEDFKRLLHRSVNILTVFCTPLIFFSIVFAPQIIGILSGNGYEGAILPMRIVMPLMLIIGYEQILVIQTLMPLKKDKAILTNSILGACFGLGFNMVLVPYLYSIGSAIVWFLSECVVLISSQYFVTRFTGFKLPIRMFVKNIMAYIPMLVLFVPVYAYVDNKFLSVIFGGVIMVFYAYILNMYIIRNSEIVQLQQRILQRVRIQRL